MSCECYCECNCSLRFESPRCPSCGQIINGLHLCWVYSVSDTSGVPEIHKYTYVLGDES